MMTTATLSRLDSRTVTAAGVVGFAAAVSLAAQLYRAEHGDWPPTLDALVVDVTDELELYRQSFKLNDARRQTTDYDNGLAWAELLQDGLVRDQDALAALVGRNKSLVSRVLCYGKLPTEVQAFVGIHRQKITARFAYEIYLLYAATKRVDKALQLAEAVVKRDLSVRETEKLRARFEQEGQVAARALRTRQIILHRDGARAGFIKEWEHTGRIVIDAQQLSPQDRQRIRDFVVQIVQPEGPPALSQT